MSHIFGNAGDLGWVAIKALLLYLTAVFGFRCGKRRTLAEMAPFDFVAAVAVGAIVGRVPNADATSYLEGACTLVVILLAHRIITALRRMRVVNRLVDFPPRLLVADGKLVSAELRRAGLTINDLYGLLRQHGIEDMSEVEYVVFEERGRISVIRRGRTAPKGKPPGLIRDVLEATS